VASNYHYSLQYACATFYAYTEYVRLNKLIYRSRYTSSLFIHTQECLCYWQLQGLQKQFNNIVLWILWLHKIINHIIFLVECYCWVTTPLKQFTANIYFSPILYAYCNLCLQIVYFSNKFLKKHYLFRQVNKPLI